MLDVDILYNANEYRIQVDKANKDGFQKMITDTKEALKIQEDNRSLKIMTINSKNKFAFVTEDNFFDLINEKFEGNVLKVCASLIQEEQSYGNDDNGKLVVQDDFDSDNDEFEIKKPEKKKDDSFDNDKKEEEKEEEKQLEEPNKIEEEETNVIKEEVKEEPVNNLIMNHEEEKHIEQEEEKKEIFKSSAIILPGAETPHPFAGLTEVKEIPIENSSSMNFAIPSEIVKKNNNKAQNLNIAQIENESKRIITFASEFSSEKCDVCGGALNNVKFICCICNSCIMCDLCEAEHPHPTVKYKTHFLSNLKETFLFIQTKQDVPKNKFINNIMSKEIELTLEPVIDTEITMRPNQTVKIPILIQNNSKVDIKSDDFCLFVRNFKKVKIFFDEAFKFTVKARSSISINLVCTSKYALCKEEIEVELYSNIIKIKDSKKKTCKLTVEVNEDMEEEKLNKIFFGYEKITILSKKHKEMILNVMNDQLSSKAPLEIYDILKNSGWNLENAIDKLIDNPETPGN